MFLKRMAQLSLVALLTVPAFTAVNAAETKERPHMDLAFCIDTTGSMQNEIDMVKTKTKELVAKLSTGKPAPIVRVGLVAYRDRGDEYVTKVFPFTDNIDQVVKDISALKAFGGGDAPEAVNEGLHAALHDLNWTDSKDAAKLLFLIGDAGPHYYVNDYKWEDESKNAISRGIQINTIGCSGLDISGGEVFQKIAKLSDGKYETLAYRQEVADTAGKKTTIVTRGGAAYTVDAPAADWKSAVTAGKLAKVAAPMSMAPAGYAPGYSGSRAMSTTAHVVGGSFIHGASRSMAVTDEAPMVMDSRRDSNLDDIVLNAAKAKAEKQLNVHY